MHSGSPPHAGRSPADAGRPLVSSPPSVGMYACCRWGDSPLRWLEMLMFLDVSTDTEQLDVGCARRR